MTLTLGNPLGGVSSGAVSVNQFAIATAGKSLSTGKTANNDVVSDFLGKGLSDKHFILSKINGNMGYSKNALEVASSSLESMAKTLVDMLAVIAQSTSDTNLATLNDILQQKKSQIALQTKSANFDNRPLLDGKLGTDSSVRTDFTNKSVSVKSPVAGNFLGVGAVAVGVQGQWTTTAAAVAAGDTLTVNGVQFTALVNGTARTDGSLNFEVGNGGTANDDSIADLLVALQDVQANGTTDQKNALANYTFSAAAAVLTISQITPTDEVLAQTLITSGVTLAIAETQAGVTATGPNSQSVLTFGDVDAGDIINIEGVRFKAVISNPSVENNEFTIGASSAATAQNFAAAFQRSASETLQSFTSSISGNALTISRVSAGTAGINVVSQSSNIKAATLTKGGASGIDLSGIKTLSGFVDVSSKPIFVLEQQLRGVNAQALAQASGNALASTPGVAAAANDSVAIYSTVIGGKKFTGSMYEADAAPNLNNAQLKMIDQDTGEYFTVTASAAYAGRIDSSVAASNTLADINALFAITSFNETKTLTVNTSQGDILVNNVPAASTTNTVVKMSSGDFTNMVFKDFIIEPGTVAGDVKFTAVITDKQNRDQSYVTNVAAASINQLVEGYKLDLTDSTGGTGNVLSINLGQRGLTSLGLAANYAGVANAYKDMLKSTGDGLEVRVGLNFDDVLKVNISDVSAPKLFQDQYGVYQPNLDISNDAGRKIAQDVVTTALAKIRSEQSKVSSQKESIQEASDALFRTIQVTLEASKVYSDTDLIDAAQAFSEAVKKTIAAISTLEAGNKVSDAAQRVIQSIA
jgi:hypothetical protein